MDQDISFSHEFLFEASVAEGGDDFVPLWSHEETSIFRVSSLFPPFCTGSSCMNLYFSFYFPACLTWILPLSLLSIDNKYILFRERSLHLILGFFNSTIVSDCLWVRLLWRGARREPGWGCWGDTGTPGPWRPGSTAPWPRPHPSTRGSRAGRAAAPTGITSSSIATTIC